MLRFELIGENHRAAKAAGVGPKYHLVIVAGTKKNGHLNEVAVLLAAVASVRCSQCELSERIHQ